MYVRLFMPCFIEVSGTGKQKALLVTISKTWATPEIAIDNKEMAWQPSATHSPL